MYKKVIKKNSKNNIVNIYNSVQECIEIENIKEWKLRTICKNHELYNNHYYEYEEIKPAYVKTKCTYCGTEFECQRWRIEKRKNIFCSKKCENEFKISNRINNKICLVCGKAFHSKPSQDSKYCSIKCHAIAKQTYMLSSNNHQFGLKGRKNASWKSDEKISYYGYKLIRKLNHPFKNEEDFVFEHRLVAEKYLLTDECSVEIDGHIYLNPQFVVHHIDFDRLNNDVNNLIIMERGEHIALHKKLKHENELKIYCNKYGLDYNTILFNKNKYKYTEQIAS